MSCLRSFSRCLKLGTSKPWISGAEKDSSSLEANLLRRVEAAQLAEKVDAKKISGLKVIFSYTFLPCFAIIFREMLS